MPRRATALACGAVGYGAVVLGLTTTIVPAATGCTTHQCDAHSLDWRTGHWIDDNTWETSELDEPWIPYDGNSTVTITWDNPDGSSTPNATRCPYNISPYIGVSSDGRETGNGDPDAGNNFSPGAGAEVEYLDWTKSHVTVLNNTCSPYLARFVIEFPDAGTAAASDCPAR